jgi:saccharopine dehydrogenase (NADP+, L-glutamate forming)
VFILTFFFFCYIASRKLENAEALAAKFPGTVAVSCDINDEKAIEDLVAQHDIAIRYSSIILIFGVVFAYTKKNFILV